MLRAATHLKFPRCKTMGTDGPRDTRRPRGTECQKNAPKLAWGARRVVVVCLDPTHRTAIERWTGSAFLVAGCPLHVLRLLQANPGRRIILDRCPATLRCCPRPLLDLQRRIRKVRPPPGTDLGAGGMIGESSHSVASRRLA